jgi:hypothetical protein
MRVAGTCAELCETLSLWQEFILADEAGFLVVWSIFRDALIKEQQVEADAVCALSFRRSDVKQVRRRFAACPQCALCGLTCVRRSGYVLV